MENIMQEQVNISLNGVEQNIQQKEHKSVKAPFKRKEPGKNKNGRKEFFYRSVHFIPGTPEAPVKKWKVQVKFRGRIENIPTLFDTEKEAHEAWLSHYKTMEENYGDYLRNKHGEGSIADQLLKAQNK